MESTDRAELVSTPSWKLSSPIAILVVLALINFLNYVDRMVLAPLVPLLKAPVEEGGLGLSSDKIGLLQLAFMLVHSLASIPLGLLADRYLRKRLIAIGVGVWSVATAAAGLANSFAQLFVARATVGIGEATYAPAASALISDRFSSATRARALGVFQLGMVLGGAVGVVAGGIVAGEWGWRAAFYVVGVPGLVLAVVALLIHETPRVPAAAVTSAPVAPPEKLPPESRIALAWINVAGILVTFFTGAVMFWGPDFVLRYHYGNDTRFLKEVSASFGAVATLAGIGGVLAGSFLADRLERRRPGAGRLMAIAIGVFASVPCAALGFITDDKIILYVALGLGVFFNVFYVGPVLAALHDVVPSHRRGVATGTYFLLIHLLGDAISPAIVGYVDKWESLRAGLLVGTGVLFLGGFAALAAIPGSRAAVRARGGSAPSVPSLH
jgi:MFS transporter, Spinster family, sphingosine-1-phosphate transporter